MEFLTKAISDTLGFQQLLEGTSAGALPAVVSGVSEIHKANIVFSLCSKLRRRAFLLCPDEAAAQKMIADLSAMGLRTLFYPSRDLSFRSGASPSHENEHTRLEVLSAILAKNFDCVVFCIDAALLYTIPPEHLEESLFPLSSGQQVSPGEVIEKLILCGFERSSQVEGVGQFALRGGILDFYPPSENAPVRAEFWGDEIDSLAYFDPETQRRGDPVDSVRICPAVEAPVASKTLLARKIRSVMTLQRGKNAQKAKAILETDAEMLESGLALSCADKYISLLYSRVATLFSYIGDDDLLFVSDYYGVKERERAASWQRQEDLKDYLEEGVLCRGLDTYSCDMTFALDEFENHGAIFLDTFLRGNYEVPVKTLCSLNVRQSSVWSGGISQLCEDLTQLLELNWSCVVLAGNEKTARLTAQDLENAGISCTFAENPALIPRGKVIVCPGALSAGIEYPEAFFALITHGQLSSATRKTPRRRRSGREISDLSELVPGDYVVHVSHGIGVYDGIHKIEMQGIIKDYIKIKYAKNDVLYVPVTQLDLVAKYIGSKEDAVIRLNTLGGTEWQKAKARARSNVKDIAKDLIDLYAARMQSQGYAFDPDGEWQRDFEARFEYEETEDQLRCAQEIKSDMERAVPMDRLLCGDVGFGKTEVALRAAFKCITEGKQCAILVPTTILAFQHYQTIQRRMEGFPVSVELLSRFRSPKQQAEILRKLSRGEIDLIVGTHRIVSKDVSFRDLGLVIIDEEQRFGVAQKEHLKNLRKNVDVLTLSATPIPRTLSMALSGIRDMSLIEEAPHDRHPVQSYVLEYDVGIICDAIRKELRRGGQVYYLHNDIASLDKTAGLLKQKIPQARIATAHGKMNENELSAIWQQLLDHEIDLLVCTTIIETGVDVPNVNTLIIDNADRMGLSQLHQLRGRVGRSSRRAYAYFTFTRDKVLSEIAQKRLTAIREFTEFGSGFKIAMRDLELRGAGNLLGAQQHGQMEAVGYDLYLKLLDEAISLQKGETPPPADLECLIDLRIGAHIPESYIESSASRIEIYRRIADIRNEDDASDVMDELIDRFGEPPTAVLGLIDIALLRNTAMRLGIYEIKEQDKLLLLYTQKLEIEVISALTQALKGLVVFGSGSKPYIGIKTLPNTEPIEAIRDTMRLIENCRKADT